MIDKFRIPGAGLLTSKIMLLGEAGGFYENQQKIPFVGKSGQLLRKILNKLDFVMNDIYITNVVKFRPIKNNNNVAPNIIDIREQAIILFNEIFLLNKLEIIITLGSTAINSLLSYVLFKENKPISITKIRGKIINFNHVKIIPTFHPSFILRTYNRNYKLFLNDLNFAKKLLKA
jgi:uracil-DNA glycosylase